MRLLLNDVTASGLHQGELCMHCLASLKEEKENNLITEEKEDEKKILLFDH